MNRLPEREPEWKKALTDDVRASIHLTFGVVKRRVQGVIGQSQQRGVGVAD